MTFILFNIYLQNNNKFVVRSRQHKSTLETKILKRELSTIKTKLVIIHVFTSQPESQGGVLQFGTMCRSGSPPSSLCSTLQVGVKIADLQAGLMELSWYSALRCSTLLYTTVVQCSTRYGRVGQFALQSSKLRVMVEIREAKWLWWGVRRLLYCQARASGRGRRPQC